MIIWTRTMYSSLDSAMQQAIFASLACFHTSILQKIITLSALWLKWHLTSSSSINFTLLFFAFSIQSLRHFPPSWLGLCPSLFIPLWKSAGPLDYNLMQLFRVRVEVCVTECVFWDDFQLFLLLAQVFYCHLFTSITF